MSKDNPEAFETFEFDLPPVRGFPELRWAGKRPFKSTQYFPAQKKESYGDPTDGWWNRIYWGDNLQVMSHLQREFRGKVDLIYIDPPFAKGADFKKTIRFKGATATTDSSSFEEKQYSDIWAGDEYMQFLFERIVLCRELLSDTGNFLIHCDDKAGHNIRALLDEIFGPERFRNEIVWSYESGGRATNFLSRKHDNIFWYSKGTDYVFNGDAISERRGPIKKNNMRKGQENGRVYYAITVNGKEYRYYEDDLVPPTDVWSISHLQQQDPERTGYPTQKPERLLERIIKGMSPDGGLVFDCFMGSGTTQAVAMKLGRRFIGADINLAAIETAVERVNTVRSNFCDGPLDLVSDAEDRSSGKYFLGVEVYNVNNYDVFRNPVEAKGLITEAMELQPLPSGNAFDGQRDGYLVKIMPVNRIATRADLNEVINGLDFKAFERRQADAPSKKVERIHLVCMGHEPDLGAELVKAAKPFDIEVIVTDLIRDKAHLHFKKASDARLAIDGGELVIEGFYPMNLLQKLSLEPDAVEKWQQLVESVKVDFNYDGAVLTPSVVDAPSKDDLVIGRYPIPDEAGTIRVKITDLLSESWEGEMENA